MNVIKCKGGHFFDGDTYSTCPLCGEGAATSDAAAASVKDEKKGFWERRRKDKSAQVAPVAPVAEMPYIPKGNPTLDFWQSSLNSEDSNQTPPAVEVSPAESDTNQVSVPPQSFFAAAPPAPPAEPCEQPILSEEAAPAPAPSLRDAVKSASVNNEGRTMSYFRSATNQAAESSAPVPATEPVVGWLVCVGGRHFGESFSIYAGKNSIGRSNENRVIISEDGGVSRVKHALIVYEPKKRNFYLQPGDSSGLTYLNDEYITDSRLLSAWDMIELGDSKLMFVPLCGETFSWDEYVSKGE